MSLSEERSALVMELAEEFIERYRKGERPPLKEYIDRHPHFAAEIKEVFPAMAMMENIAVADSSLEGEEADKKPEKPVDVALKQLGDYRIIREIGHGGMGIVYEAEQVSLGRHVALKVLPNQALADAKHKRRFEREAKAAAKLHHTNIVPVFGVGEHEGLPYYVMQFIQGLGLDVVLDELNHMHPPNSPPSQGGVRGVAHTPTGLPTAGEIRISRRSVAAAEVARSLLTGAFHQAAASDEGPETPRQPVFAATMDEPAAGPGKGTGPPKSHAPTRSAASNASGLSESFTVSSSSIILPGSSATTGSKGNRKKQSYWQSVANIGRQVADALEYAHKQGILHRDIKPSNLLLDLRGTVWVTDFGLAKVAGPGGDNLTHTGDILGTLRYMPPEAFEGKSEPRGDVYSLGLTMYELLAMRPAFDEKDRNKLIKHVTTGEPTPLHKINRETPRDLVTIVHKAIDRDPARRYATAEDMASDLQRFLDDEPILARRQTQLERYVRWARHNPGIAILGGVLTAVLVFATLASLFVASRMSTLANKEAQAAVDERAAREEADEAKNREAKQRGQAEQAKQDAEESRRRAENALQKAEDNFAKARAAVNDYLTAVSEDERLKAPGLQALRVQLLQSALQFYQEFLKERGTDPTLRQELASVYYKIGEIYQDLGQPQAAKPARTQSRRMYEALSADHPDDAAIQYGLAMSLARTGSSAEAAAILEKLVQPNDPKYWYDLSLVYTNIAVGDPKNTSNDKQLDFLRKSLTAAERLVQLKPDDPNARVVMSASLNNIAIRIWQKHDAEALELLRRATEEDEAAYRLAPNHPLVARFLTIGLNNVANTALRLGLTEEALAAHRRRVEVLDRRARDNPAIPDVDAALANGLTTLVHELHKAGRSDEAAKTVEKARDRLAETTGDSTEYFRQVSYFHLTALAVASACAKTATNGQAQFEAAAAAAVAALRQQILAGGHDDKWLKTDSRTEPLRQRADFKALVTLMEEMGPADAAARRGSASADEKVAARQKILTTLNTLAGPLPSSRFVRRSLAQAQQELAQALLDAGQVDEARQAFDDALLVRQQLVQEAPSNEQLRADLAQSQSAAGDLFAAAGKLADAVQTWDKALTTLDESLKTSPNSVPYRAALAERLLHVAAQASKFGLWDIAVKHYERAVAIQSPTEPITWNFIALVAAQTQDLPLLHAIAKLAARNSSENTGDPGTFRHRALVTSPIAAAAHAAAVLKLADEFQNPWHNYRWARALAALRAGQAEKAFQSVEGLTPAEKAWPEWQTLALIQHHVGHDKEAAEALRQADVLADRRMQSVIAGDQLKLPLIWDEWLHNELLRAEAHQAIHGKPLPASPYQTLFRARVFFALEERDKAEAEFAAAVAIRPDDADVWLTRSRVYAKLGRNDIMAADLLHAQKLRENDPRTWIETGRMLAERGEHRQADAAFARASALGMSELNRFLEAGWWAVGPYPEQLDMPCPPELNPDPSKQAAAVGEKRELKWQSVATTVHNGSIDTGAIAGSRRNATYYFLAYVHADRDRTATLVLRSGADARLWVNGRLTLAGMVDWKIGSASDVYIPISLNEGRNTLLIKSRHTDKVHNWCECMFLDSPVRRGYELAHLGLWADAANAFANADRRGPLNEYQLRLWIQSLAALGRDEEARQVFAEMVRRHDQSGSLGVAETDFLPPNKSEERERRIVAWRKHVEANPTNAPGYHRLANALFRAGHFAEAETNLRKAMTNDQLYFHPLLASTLHYLGRFDEANKCLAEIEEKHARLVKEALAANVYRVPLDWEEEVWYQAMLREARTLILGKDSGPSADETALLARARARLAELDKAEDDYARLVEKQVNQPRLWIDCGRRLGELRRWDEAAKAFAKAIDLAPKDVQIWKERGRAYADLGKWDEAAADFVKAIETAPPPSAKPPQFPWAVDRAGIDDALVKYDEVFDRVTKLRPKDTVLWTRRAQHFARLGRWAEAEASLLRQHELDPGDHWGPYRAAPLMLLRGDVEGYRSLAAAFVKRFGGTNGWSRAEKVVGTALLLPDEFADFASLQAMLDRVKDAKEDLYAIRKMRIARALLAYRSRDFAEAVRQLTVPGQPTEAPSNSSAEVLVLLSLARHQLGENAAARETLAKARALVDKYTAVPDVGWLYSDSTWDSWVRGRLFLREAESLIPPDPVLAGVNSLSPQEAAARRERKTRADRLAIQAALAHIRLDVGQKKEAEAELRAVMTEREKIVAEEPGSLDYQADLAAAHEQLGQFLVSDGRIEEGVRATQQAVALLEHFAAGNPKIARLQVSLASTLFAIGELHWKAGRLAEGRQAWQRALESLSIARGAASKDPKLAKMAVELELVAGRAFADLGLWTEASEHFRRAFAMDPVAGKVTDRLAHASLLVLTGAENEYRQYCKNVYERSGNNVQEWWYARMIVLRPGALPDPTTAVALAREARSASKNEPWTVLYQALAQLRADQVDDAFVAFREFEKMSKGEWAFSWPALALARHKAGKIDEAREWLRKAEDWYADTWEKHLAAGASGLPKDGDLTFWAFFLSLRQEAIATVTGQPAPADSWLHLHRGRVYVQLGAADKAEAELQAAVKAQPDDARILLTRSRIHAALGKDAEARADRQRAVQLAEQTILKNPDNKAAADVVAALLLEKAHLQWTSLKPFSAHSENGATLTVQSDQSVLAGGNVPDTDSYTLEFETQGPIAAFRLETLTDQSLNGGGPGRSDNGNYILSNFRVTVGDRNISWLRAFADFSQTGHAVDATDYHVSLAIDQNPSTGWAVHPNTGQSHWAVFVPAQPLGGADKTRLTVHLEFRNKHHKRHTLGRFRLSVTGDAEVLRKDDWLAAAATPRAKVAAAYLVVGKLRQATDFLTKALTVNPRAGPADWLVLALAHAKLNETNQVAKACAQAAELLRATGADAALHPLVREVVLAMGVKDREAQRLIAAAAAGNPPAALNEAIKKQPDKAEGYRNRGDWFAARGRWKEAIADFAEIFRIDPNSLDAMRLGILLAYNGDKDRYREHCQAMLGRWGSTEDNFEADQTLKTIILMADSKAEANQLTRLAAVAVAGDEHQASYEWFLFVKGLHDYRMGKYADAVAACRASRQRSSVDSLTALDLMLEAMAERTLDDAKRSLNEAKAMLDHFVPGIDGSDWPNWLFAHLLYREAEGLIASRKNE